MSRGSQKHERETVKSVEAIDPRIKARIEGRSGSNAHRWVVLEIGGAEVMRHSVASSPKDPHTMVQALTRECRRTLESKGILDKPAGRAR